VSAREVHVARRAQRPALQHALAVAALAAALGVLAGCRPGRPPVAAPSPPPPPEPSVPQREVRKVQGDVVIAAWSEPARLPSGGGQAQILVRVEKRGGAALAGVEVRLQASFGSLYSRGRILRTASNGMTRDRLTTNKTTTITLDAGGTRYRFLVPVGAPRAE
jgi:hypothetical protein